MMRKHEETTETPITVFHHTHYCSSLPSTAARYDRWRGESSVAWGPTWSMVSSTRIVGLARVSPANSAWVCRSLIQVLGFSIADDVSLKFRLLTLSDLVPFGMKRSRSTCDSVPPKLDCVLRRLVWLRAPRAPQLNTGLNWFPKIHTPCQLVSKPNTGNASGSPVPWKRSGIYSPNPLDWEPDHCGFWEPCCWVRGVGILRWHGKVSTIGESHGAQRCCHGFPLWCGRG